MAHERLLIESGEIVVGIDEVGRGALAGPLFVGAVVARGDLDPPEGLADSKALTARRRESLIDPLMAWSADWAIGSVEAGEIDAWGLRSALAVAATRALDRLSLRPTFALIDGPLNLLESPASDFSDWSEPSEGSRPPLTYAGLAHRAVVRGDQRCASIAAAAVIAKVARDRLMAELDEEFPAYGWAANKGYGTPAHLEALARWGPCALHRRTWSLPAAGVARGLRPDAATPS